MRADAPLTAAPALGFEAYAHGWCFASGPKIVARLEGSTARGVTAGSVLPLTAAASSVHLFDSKTGLSLDAT